MEVCQAEDEVWTLADYERIKLCKPEAHGHKRTMDNGVESVLVPVQERKRVRRLSMMDAVLETHVADNTLHLNKQEIHNMQADIIEKIWYLWF